MIILYIKNIKKVMGLCRLIAQHAMEHYILCISQSIELALLHVHLDFLILQNSVKR
jgi:hypothetical protein